MSEGVAIKGNVPLAPPSVPPAPGSKRGDRDGDAEVERHGAEPFDVSALSKNIGPGQRLVITLPDGSTIQAKKEGPDRYLALKRNVNDASGSFGKIMVNGANISFGTDPATFSLAALGASYTVYNALSLASNALTSVQTLFPVIFRFISPVMSTLKAINTWKLSKAQTGQNAKAGHVSAVLADTAHAALDIGVAVGLAVAMIRGTSLGPISADMLTNIGWLANIAAFAYHGSQAGIDWSSVVNGDGSSSGTDSGGTASLTERGVEARRKWWDTYSGWALIRRVFHGEEPLDDKPVKNNK